MQGEFPGKRRRFFSQWEHLYVIFRFKLRKPIPVQVSSRKELGIASVPYRRVVGAQVCKIDLASQ